MPVLIMMMGIMAYSRFNCWECCWAIPLLIISYSFYPLELPYLVVGRAVFKYILGSELLR